MKTIQLIRHKHLYRIWFIRLVRNMIASPNFREQMIRLAKNPTDEYFNQLFKVGNLKPASNFNPGSKIFSAHINGINTVIQQIDRFTTKYPQLAKLELIDSRWVRFVVDWADTLAGQAAAACNVQSQDADDVSNADRCVDAWLAYNDFIIELGMAQDDLDDCLFQNSNPPETETSDSPFGSNEVLDPCLTQAMDVILAENNVNAAWEDINRFC